MRAVLYGVGSTGQEVARLLLRRGATVTGAIGRTTNVGRDLGEVIDWPEPLGVPVSADADAVLAQAKADVAVLTVTDDLASSYPCFERCARAGADILSLSEPLFYPWRLCPDLAARLDALARETGRTILGCGYQDVFWLNLPLILSGASESIEAIESLTVIDAGKFGVDAAVEHCGVGKPDGSFTPTGLAEAFGADPYRIAHELLALELGLTIASCHEEVRSIVAERSVPFSGFGRAIEPGEILGTSSVSRLTTVEGLTVTSETCNKILAAGEHETTRVSIRGVPCLQLDCGQVDGGFATCTTLVNRIPDVLAAPPGLITVQQLPAPRWKARFG